MVNDIFLGCLDQVTVAATGHNAADFNMADLLAVVEKAKQIPRPEFDCIVMTEAAYLQFRDFLANPPGPQHWPTGTTGMWNLASMEVFTAKTPGEAEKLASTLREKGRRPLLVSESRPEDYGPSPLAEALEAWWKLNRAEFGPTMVPPCFGVTNQGTVP